ncbi:MAG TPA: FKBP-type peptidyl-prolyl cis-trans isomerase [Candidatus Saccharimonadales bacterium]|jgi:FKBP-type peptidyl-prolyl cis-trans isomerase
MSTTRKRDRIIALVIAILFFGFASALTIIIIVQAVISHNNSKSTNTSSSTNSQAQSLTGTQLSGFTPVSSVPSLKITDAKVGTGTAAKASDTVTVDYTGAIASTGIIFQSTQGSQPVSLSLSQVIKGWQLGIPGMKVGGTRQLLIPANEAYGANPPSGSGIPANAPLVFDITLDKIGS